MTTETAPAWPELILIERRLLGVLVEKAKTTPDAYPLSLNSVVTGSNQKSNRDPLLSLNDGDVEDVLARLKDKGLVSLLTGSRVERWKHNLYETWGLGKVDLAIIGELLLRGPQTEGELRGRASRMEPIEDLEKLRGLLKPLAERKLVVYLSPENRRGTMLTHGFHGEKELERLKSLHSAGAPVSLPEVASPAHARAALPSTGGDEARIAALEQQLGELRAELNLVKSDFAQLAGQFKALKDSLGG